MNEWWKKSINIDRNQHDITVRGHTYHTQTHTITRN